MFSVNASLPKKSIVAVVYPTGSRFDPLGKSGLAHFAEHMFVESKNKRFPNVSFERALDKEGIYLHALTNSDRIAVYLIAPEERKKEARDLLLEHLQDITVNDEVFEREKRVVLQELAEEVETNSFRIWNAGMEKLFGASNPLVRPITGIASEIKKISSHDVSDYFEKNLPLETAFILTIEQNTVTVEEPTDTSVLECARHAGGVSLPESSSSKTYIPNRESDSLSEIELFFKTVPFASSHERAALLVLEYCLAHSSSGLLLRRLREEMGIVYDVGTDTNYYAESGFFSIFVRCSSTDTNTVIEEIASILERLAQGIVDNDLFDVAKKIFASSFNFSTAGPLFYLDWVSYDLIYGVSYESPVDMVRSVNKLSPEEIVAVAKQYLDPAKAHIVIASGDGEQP